MALNYHLAIVGIKHGSGLNGWIPTGHSSQKTLASTDTNIHSPQWLSIDLRLELTYLSDDFLWCCPFTTQWVVTIYGSGSSKIHFSSPSSRSLLFLLCVNKFQQPWQQLVRHSFSLFIFQINLVIGRRSSFADARCVSLLNFLSEVW